MNTSHRNTNKEIQEILQRPIKKESAFNGTVLEGRERRYTVINERDIKKHLEWEDQVSFNEAYNNLATKIETGRTKEGKKPFNSYIVINTDEPYIHEILLIMKKHGHWENEIIVNSLETSGWIINVGDVYSNGYEEYHLKITKIVLSECGNPDDATIHCIFVDPTDHRKAITNSEQHHRAWYINECWFK